MAPTAGTPTAPTPESLPDQVSDETRAPLEALELLSGDARTFLEKVWATRTHIEQLDDDATRQLVATLTLDDADRLLTGTAIRTPAVRIAKDGTVLPASSYTRPATIAGQALTGLLDPGKVFALFDDGATVVLQGLHRYWAPLGALVADLELALGHPCQANAYLTPPAAQGFAVHSDSHDVFVFQTHGSKVWEVHDPGSDTGGETGPQTVVLEPGISMYLPTGTPHAARAQESVSLHVTIGINQITWRQVLERALGETLEAQGGGHLPAGYLDDPSLLADGLSARLASLATALRDLDPATVTEAEVHRFLTGRTLWQRGGLRDRVAAGDLTDDSVLRRRGGHPCVLVPDGDRLRVLLGDRELVMPVSLSASLEAVRDVRPGGTLRPADLAGLLDEQSRLVVCRRLVREGLLEVVG
jgi:lysine-specific demethylase/histidyl-hydroxylase NO66